MGVCGAKSKASGPAGAGVPGVEFQSSELVQNESFDFGNTLKFPLLGDPQKKELTKGVYEITGYVRAGNSEPVSKSDFVREFEVQGENKKVRFKRVSISTPEMIQGEELSKLKMVFSIDQNPIPIALIIWGAVGATGLTTAGYFINSVNRFTESSFNQFLTIAGIAVTAYFALK